eukprot:8478410-Karenia_brevis.AAC.1
MVCCTGKHGHALTFEDMPFSTADYLCKILRGSKAGTVEEVWQDVDHTNVEDIEALEVELLRPSP